ncbi:MAG: S-layer homology domain-containing protein [Armatimonadota bacterium]|nr:S-layer homology domain-containing protein [Armatimonadota bacterium]
MKQLAVVLAAILTLTLVAPAFAQPFADVPTDHWAYDAIAELAAKGLIEGYPDGAFRGDRAMTRYEMAMVVARLLARIEAIKIPPLPPDLVRRAELAKAQAAEAAARTALDKRLTSKLATIQRLVAEFRAELAALGVRVTAVEEELAAIRARLDNTRIAGDLRFRYNVSEAGTSDGRLRTRIQFSGRGGPNTEVVVRLFTANNAGVGGSYDTRFGLHTFFGNVSFDRLYLDIRNTWGATLWRAGRQHYTLNGLGPYGTGLLYDPQNAVGFAGFQGRHQVSAANAALDVPYTAGIPGTSDGLRSDWALGPLNVTAAVFVERANVALPAAGGVSAAVVRDNQILTVSSSQLLPGWTLAGSYYNQAINPVNPANFGGRGWEFVATGTLFPGLSVYGNYASWNGRPVAGGPDWGSANAWRVGGNLNLAQIAGIAAWNPTLDFQYHQYGPLPAACATALTVGGGGYSAAGGGCFPSHTYATTIVGQAFAFNMRGWLARLNLTITPRTVARILYEGGTVLCASAGCATTGSYYEWWLRLEHTVAPNTTLTLNYYKANASPAALAGTATGDYLNFYRAELLYSW